LAIAFDPIDLPQKILVLDQVRGFGISGFKKLLGFVYISSIEFVGRLG
jgi:hypothetical protein